MADLASVFKSQQEYFNSGATLDLSTRRIFLERLLAAIKHFESEILEAIYNDLGRDATTGYITEINPTIKEIEDTISNFTTWADDQKASIPLVLAPAKGYIRHVPQGQILIISPWNYPFMLTMQPLVSAIAAGNTVSIKPSEISLNVSEIIKKIINEVFEPHYVSCHLGDAEVSQTLTSMPFDHIFFTGSTTVGKIIYQQAAKTMAKVTLELGGKSPCILSPDAIADENLKVCLKRILWGKFLNSGQTCTAPDYLLIPKGSFEQLKDLAIQILKESYGENPIASKYYSKIISSRHYDRLFNFKTQLITKYDSSKFIDFPSETEERKLGPLICLIDNLDEEIMSEEIFGPLLPVIEYQNESELKTILNKNQFPLASYVFFMEGFSNETQNWIQNIWRTGALAVNDVLIQTGIHSLPFGGVKFSGIGVYHGKYGFEAFSQIKSEYHKYGWDISNRYIPYKFSFNFIKRLLSWFS